MAGGADISERAIEQQRVCNDPVTILMTHVFLPWGGESKGSGQRGGRSCLFNTLERHCFLYSWSRQAWELERAWFLLHSPNVCALNSEVLQPLANQGWGCPPVISMLEVIISRGCISGIKLQLSWNVCIINIATLWAYWDQRWAFQLCLQKVPYRERMAHWLN